MQLFNRPVKLFATALLGLAFSAAALAQGLAETSPRPKIPGATPGEPSATSTMGKSAKVVQADYKAAYAKCKEMKGAERRTCRAEAKAARNDAMSSVTGTGTRASAANTSEIGTTGTKKSGGGGMSSDTMGKSGRTAGPAGTTKPLGGS